MHRINLLFKYCFHRRSPPLPSPHPSAVLPGLRRMCTPDRSSLHPERKKERFSSRNKKIKEIFHVIQMNDFSCLLSFDFFFILSFCFFFISTTKCMNRFFTLFHLPQKTFRSVAASEVTNEYKLMFNSTVLYHKKYTSFSPKLVKYECQYKIIFDILCHKCQRNKK